MPQPPDQEAGSWEKSVYNSKVVGIHAALLRDGSVLFFSHGNPTGCVGAIEVGSAVLSFLAPAVTQQELDPGVICSGHTFVRDGRLIACGSERDVRGLHALRQFNPADGESGEWRHLADLTEARWYPTCVELPDGRVLIVGGQQWSQDEGTPNCTFQVYDPERGMHPPRPLPLLCEEGAMYPFTFVLPSGQALIHAGRKTCFLDLDTLELDGRVLEAAEREGRNSRTYDLQGTAVLLPLRPDDDPPYRARVMLLGGGGAPEVTANRPATNTCEILDLGEAEPAWRLAEPMAHRRVMPDAVLLPDGNVLVTNGSSTGKADAGVNPVFETELYDVERGVWTTLCSMQIPRLYHSVALLLPDARVLTAGEDSIWHPGLLHGGEAGHRNLHPALPLPRAATGHPGSPRGGGLRHRVQGVMGGPQAHQVGGAHQPRLGHTLLQLAPEVRRAVDPRPAVEDPDPARAARREGRAPGLLHAVPGGRTRHPLPRRASSGSAERAC